MKNFQITIESVKSKSSGDSLIPDNCLISVLSDLQNSIKATSLDLLNNLERDLKYKSLIDSTKLSIAIDAAKNRIREYKGPTFFITRTQNGSLVITGALTALAYYVLSKTIGEAFGEAWKESELHGLIKDWFRRQIDAIPELIRNKYRRRLNHRVETGIIDEYGFDFPEYLDMDLYVKPGEEVPFFALDDDEENNAN